MPITKLDWLGLIEGGIWLTGRVRIGGRMGRVVIGVANAHAQARMVRLIGNGLVDCCLFPFLLRIRIRSLCLFARSPIRRFLRL